MSVKTYKGAGVTLTFDNMYAIEEPGGDLLATNLQVVVFIRDVDGTVQRVDTVLNGKTMGAFSRRMMFRDGHTVRNAPWPPRLEAQSKRPPLDKKRKWWQPSPVGRRTGD